MDRIRAAMPKALDEAVETAWEAQRSMLEDLGLDDQDADSKVKRARQKGMTLTYEKYRDKAIKLAPTLKPATSSKYIHPNAKKGTNSSTKEKESSPKEDSKPFSGVCFNCGKTGHRASACPDPPSKEALERRQRRKAAQVRSLTTMGESEFQALVKARTEAASSAAKEKAKEDFPKDQ